MKKNLKHSYLLIGLLIFIWILKDTDFFSLKEGFLKINIIYFFAALPLYFPIILIKSHRFKKIMEAQNIFYPLKDSFLIYGASMFLGLATPGRLGDFSKIFYLKKNNLSFSKAAFPVLTDKFLDLFVVLSFIFITLFFIPFPFSFNFHFSLGRIFFLILFLVLSLIIFLKYKKYSRPFFTEIKDVVKKRNVKILFYVIFLTFLDLFISFLLNYFIAASVGIHNKIGFLYLSFSSALVFLINILPVSILGIGVRDASFLFLFREFGVSKEIIILFSSMIVISYLSLYAICFFCWTKKPLFK